MLSFATPLALALLIAAPLFLEEGVRKRFFRRLGFRRLAQYGNAIAFSSGVEIEPSKQSWKIRTRGFVLSSLSLFSFCLLVVALARPQTSTSFAEITASGRDIMLVLDISGSMQAMDFSINNKRVDRLTALQAVTKEFIRKRKGDRMGLVVFGEQAFTQCPLTLDQRVLSQYVDALEIGMAGTGTAIGDAIAVALKRIKEIKSDSKVLILVTDGKDNTGTISPGEAAKIAKKLGVKIYTIGIGGNEPAPFPIRSMFGGVQLVYKEMEFDEKTLISIAEETGAKYFHAKNTDKLQDVYKEIDSLEERKETRYEYIDHEEQFLSFLLLGIILLLAHETLRTSVYLKVP
ncbi:hypothetical protein BVY02_02370 [bacterium J17]|nr:hypothetical protein BVY02_02370 [bacterium J17]